MAREYGKLYVRMWGDKDFISLPASAQRMYMFLSSQPDLSNCGTITFALRRWAGCVGDESTDDILHDLKVLAARKFLIVDMEREEVLVRSFVKWDGGWRSPNMMISIKAAATQALSETVRAVLRNEIGKLDTSHLPSRVNDRTGRSTKDFIELLIGQIQDVLNDDSVDENVANWGNETLHESVNETLTERVNVFNPSLKGSAKGSLTATATATAIDSTAIDTTATAIDTTGEKADPKRDPYSDDFERFWEAYPLKNGKAAAFKAFKKALRNVSAQEIIDGAQRYRDDPNREPGYTKYPQGWLNDGRWTDGPLPTRGGNPSGYLTRTQRAQAEWDEDRRIHEQILAEQEEDRHAIGG